MPPSAHQGALPQVHACSVLLPAPSVMFVSLSKKIAMPNGVELKSLSWSTINGYIVCGGQNGLLKVIKLATCGPDGAFRTSRRLSMNQTLEGHDGSVTCVCWNEKHCKLVTSDQNGHIIVSSAAARSAPAARPTAQRPSSAPATCSALGMAPWSAVADVGGAPAGVDAAQGHVVR